jgi:hypothetical protein
MRFPDWVLILTLIFAWYHVGIVWLVQVVSWPIFVYVGPNEFEAYHLAWWRGIRYVIFVPSGLTLVGTILLLRFTPSGVPHGILWAALGLYVLTYLLTAVWWGPQQMKLKDPHAPQFGVILKTHWVRTTLVSGYAAILLAALALHMKA